MLATKIKMKPSCYYSQSVLEIDKIYITGCTNPGYFNKADVHDHLIKHPGSIQVNIYPYPNLIPAISSSGEKYVRSVPNGNTHDNLLDLARE